MLLYVQHHAKQLRIVTPCVTSHAITWLKAVEVVAGNGINIVCLLGPFHTMMSYQELLVESWKVQS